MNNPPARMHGGGIKVQNSYQSDAKSRAGWRPKRWADEADLSRSKTYQLIKDGTIKTVKIGSARVIITPPAEYLASQGAER
jgi:hypothetical protein